jgi:RNA 3'-terminal phosphate cyclase (ATP)
MLTIDGSEGEGGGQMLRTSLSLSLLTGQPFRFVNLRARRSKPGLMRQHLTALQAAAALSNASVEGDSVGAQEVTFRPGSVRPGDYSFAVGTAGSTTLVLQTILPALMLSDAPSTLLLEGGTHNPSAPAFEFLSRAFLPLLGRMGPQVDVDLERAGFYPAGGGRLRVRIAPVKALSPLELPERGALLSQRARALVASLPRTVAERELAVCESLASSQGPGNVLLLELEHEHVTEVFIAFGERGVSAERVAERATREAREYLASPAAAGTHLADQLLLPLALAGRGSFRTLEPSSHTRTQTDVIRKFLGVEFCVEARAANDYSISVQQRS